MDSPVMSWQPVSWLFSTVLTGHGIMPYGLCLALILASGVIGVAAQF